MGTYSTVISRKIIYVTGTRADYGLMRGLLKTLHAAKDIDLSLCVTGMHLSALYGDTLKEIEAENFNLCGIVPVDVEQSTPASMAKSVGQEIIGMTTILEREKPDLIMILGDRGEMLAAAIAAIHLNIPIVHFHGGERSGTVDEMVRHAISKLSHYHFVATDESKTRLCKMGENEEKVFVVGAPGLDDLVTQVACTREGFYNQYGLTTDKKVALLIYHPVVQEYNDIKSQFQNVLNAALKADLQIICLEPNSDAGGHLLRDAIEEYRANKSMTILKHLPRSAFIDCLTHVDVLLGNSSSGIIEAASFDLIAVNVGSRQNMRECGNNVIHVGDSLDAVGHGLDEALKRTRQKYHNLYGDGQTGKRCYHLLKTLPLDSQLLNKCNAY